MVVDVQSLPVRIYEAGQKLMIAAPMPGLAPQDIAVTVDGQRVSIRGAQRGPRQHAIHLLAMEWTVGPYEREVRLTRPVVGPLTNVTYGNGVLVIAMPSAPSGEPGVAAEIRLEGIESTRGQHVGHVGRVPKPTTTADHRRQKHAQRVARSCRSSAPTSPPPEAMASAGG
jgi:HSP20 family protein